MEQDEKLTKKERVKGFFYTLFVFSLFTGLSIYLLSSSPLHLHRHADKNTEITKKQQLESIRKHHQSQQHILNNLFARIETYSPGINSSYDESEILQMIRDTEYLYHLQPDDIVPRLSSLYIDWLSDRKEIWIQKRNISGFQANLEQCQMDLNQ